MQNTTRWLIAIVVVVFGSFTALWAIKDPQLNAGDRVLRRSDPSVGAHASPVQDAQLRSINTMLVIYRANGVYAPY